MSNSPKPSMNHESAFAQLGAFALGALDSSDDAAVSRHVEKCSACRDELASMRTVANAMPHASFNGVMPPDRSRLIRNSLVDRAGNKASIPIRTNNWRMVALAAAAGIFALSFAYYKEREQRTTLASAFAARTAIADSLSGLVRDKDSQLAAITGPAVNVVELTSSGVRAPSARMFWDRATNRWTIYAHGLAVPKTGNAYELWLVTADAKIPAGTFKPASDGSAVYTATYALQPGDLKAIAITEEPEGGVPAPTGAVILLGSVAGT